MKHELAFNLIGKQLDWSDAQFAGEFRELQLMIDHKYDAYQGFQPATRFHVALLNWLSQFAKLADRQTAYKLIKDRLIFVSQREMHHLVSLMMPIVERHARSRMAHLLNMPLYLMLQDGAACSRLDLMRRRTLYVGLSDGARIDVFRRYNEGQVSNEQVVAFSEISEDKWEDLQSELRKNLMEVGPRREAAQFEVVCLVDDFTGSGSSLIRWENGQWKGKIAKFHKANDHRRGKALTTDCLVHIHHHLASRQAKTQIERDLQAFSQACPGFAYETTFSYVLPQDIVVSDKDPDVDLITLLRTWYDKKIEDKHTGKDIWFGYKQCGLPLVLEHNTPNNSVALLWAASEEEGTPQMKPLFARRKRHSSNG